VTRSGISPIGLLRVSEIRYDGCMKATPRRHRQACAGCNRLFLPVRSSQEYCSTQCRVAAWREWQRARSRTPLRPCEQCGHAIGPDMRADASYCSGTCRAAAHRAQKREEQRASSPDVVN
jgi:predicted nucleic acid-binding Zn ribbon protein